MGNKNTNNKKYEVRTSLYGLNKVNQYLNSEILMDDDCNGGKDDYSQWYTRIVAYIIRDARVRSY